jgi:hypothetical protein
VWIDVYSIKPIETDYDGYAFRSRTEARYAHMWRTLFWPYEFEKQSFVLDAAPSSQISGCPVVAGLKSRGHHQPNTTKSCVGA